MKSHVTLELKTCPMCGKVWETGVVLMDRQLRPVFERQTNTGWGPCKDCNELHQKGYIALIECDPSKSAVDRATDTSMLHEVWRTGKLVFIRPEMFAAMFPGKTAQKGIVLVEPGVIQEVEAAIAQASAEHGELN